MSGQDQSSCCGGESLNQIQSPSAVSDGQVTIDMFNELQLEVMQLRAELAKLRGVVAAEDDQEVDEE
ncbi:MAG: hypothetical protein ACJZ8O_03435 [Pirellulaceae bacterium]